MDNTKPDSNIQLFDGHGIRHEWDEESQQWYFSIVDVVGALTESKAPAAYWRKLKERLKKEGNESVTNCHALKMKSADGRMRLTDVATVEEMLRLIQSVPSSKAEPIKLWLAKTGAERIAEEEDPEIAIIRARESYLRKGYPPEWVDQRIMSIRVRNELTDQWKAHGVQDPREYSTLTATVHQGTFGITPKAHKEKKGLKSQNLRDNMTTLETVLSMLGEATTTELTRTQNPDGFKDNLRVARQGGAIAGETRRHIEKVTGRSVVSSLNAKSLTTGEDDAPAIATTIGKKS